MDNQESALSKITRFLTGVAGRIIILALLVLVCVYGLKTAYDFGHEIFYQEPMEAAPGTDIDVTIEQDSDLDSVAALLKEDGLIRNEVAFKVQGILYKTDIYPGEFTLNTSMTTREILEVLNTEPETTAAETDPGADSDIIGGGDDGLVDQAQVEAAGREGIELEAETPEQEETSAGEE